MQTWSANATKEKCACARTNLAISAGTAQTVHSDASIRVWAARSGDKGIIGELDLVDSTPARPHFLCVCFGFVCI